MEKDRLDALFGEGFTESAKVDKKLIKKFNKERLKEQKEAERKQRKHERETDKAFVKSEKRRIRDLNKAIDRNDGLIEEDGYLFYRTKEKFKRDKKTYSSEIELTRNRPRGLFNLIVNIIKWFKTKLIPAIVSIFKRNNKKLEYTNNMIKDDITEQPQEPEKVQEKEQENEKENGYPVLSEPVKLLYTYPLLKADKTTPTPTSDIVKEYLEFSEKQGQDGNKEKIGIFSLLSAKLNSGQPITDKNLEDIASFLTGYECKFDSELKYFLFTMNTSDGTIAQVSVSDNGDILIPEYAQKTDGSMVENSLKGKELENENICFFANFLKEYPNLIHMIVTENMISDSELNVIKKFMVDYPETKTMEDAVKEFENSNTNPEVYKMLNKTMARISYMDNVSPATILEYGFVQPSKVIPKLSNISKYPTVLQATLNFVAGNLKLADAYILADSFIVKKDNEQLEVITDEKKIDLIDKHIVSLYNRGIHPPLIANLVETYNACADERATRIAIASIDNQLNSKRFINDIIHDGQTLSYSDSQIAEDISKAINEKSIKELKDSFNEYENTPLNNYIRALSFDELMSISAHLSQEDRVLFNQVVSSTKGEPEQEKPSMGDKVLNENTFNSENTFNNDEGLREPPNEIFRVFNDDEHDNNEH